MNAEATDEQLAEQAKTGSRDAFQVLYTRYLPRVYNRVRSKVPQNDIEDVTQDIFIAVARSLGNFEQRARFNTWLYTIVNRQIADYYRRRNRGGGGGLPVELDDPEESYEIPSTVDQDQADQRLIIEHALQRVPEHYQDIITMRFSDGLTFAEIAHLRGQTLEAVKSLYRRAIQAVREGMGEEIYGTDEAG
jgi:RNA polymerase sigma-70 factor (ECF subfamily)